jgi:hypothetical protein
VQKLVIGGGVEAADVNIAVSMNSILQALLDRLRVAGRREDSRDRLGNRRVLLEESKEVFINGLRRLGSHNLLRGRSRVARSKDGNPRRAAAL